MEPTFLIIVSGPSCTGKTTLAKAISKHFNLPFITKDGIKEILFDDLGWEDREWSKKLGKASYSILDYFLNSLLSVGKSFIIESNFKPEFATADFKKLQEKYSFHPIQIMCQADGEVLFKRFKDRSESGLRHPGHRDHLNYEEFKPLLLKGKFDSMDIGGDVLIFDSTDLGHLDYSSVISQLEEIIKRPHPSSTITA